MSNIYICEGMYHILIAICKAKKDDKILIISDHIDYIKDFSYRLEKSEIFSEVKLYYQKKDINNREILDYYRKNSKYYFYFFYDESSLARIFRKNKIYYHLLEDGYNVFKILKPRFKNYYIRRFLNYFNFSAVRGYSKYCLSIEVNEINGIPIDERKNKFIENPKRKIFSSLSLDLKEKIKYIYEFNDFISTSDSKKILILTQPLFLDNWDNSIKSEVHQFNYYKNIYFKYINNYKIFIKPHPRDRLDYSPLTKAIIISKTIPIELFEIFSEHNFDVGITHSSTSLDYLTCVKEKIFLKDLRK